jgi:hypothetical protein
MNTNTDLQARYELCRELATEMVTTLLTRALNIKDPNPSNDEVSPEEQSLHALAFVMQQPETTPEEAVFALAEAMLEHAQP